MMSYKLFVFYFSISFVLLFSWIELSRGDIIEKTIHFEEIPQKIVVDRIPNIPKAKKSDVPASDTLPASVESSQRVSAPNVGAYPSTESAASFTSAPEKVIMDIHAITMPSASLIQMYKTIMSSAKLEPLITPVRLELVDDRLEPRGKMTMEIISLVVPLASSSESVKVLLHELGHVVDIKFLKPGIILGDPSEKFYGISWVDISTKKPWMGLQDFVSGYAMTNKYEDFGESFTFFLFHNDEFAKRAKQSKTLQAKYTFFQKYVFPNKEFVGTGFELDRIPKYNWDSTKIPIATNKYLFYIK